MEYFPFHLNHSNTNGRYRQHYLGLEKHFYETSDGASVYNDITDLENQQSLIISELKENFYGFELDFESILNFIAYLAIRTKHSCHIVQKK